MLPIDARKLLATAAEDVEEKIDSDQESQASIDERNKETLDHLADDPLEGVDGTTRDHPYSMQSVPSPSVWGR